MPAADEGTLRLPARVDAAAAAALYREIAPRAARLTAIDFSAVQMIDSAGVALVRVLCAKASQAGATPQLRQLPPRYAQLCLAHRVEPGRH